MQIKINLNDYPIDKLQLMAKVKLQIIQNLHTIARDVYIDNYIKNNKKSTGFFWRKTYTNFIRDEAIARLDADTWNFLWRVIYSKENLSNEMTKFFNSILKLNEYENHTELILNAHEYNWLMN